MGPAQGRGDGGGVMPASIHHDLHEIAHLHLGMRIEPNPYPDPVYFQTIGILDAEARR